MNGSRWFTVGIVAFLLLMFAISYNLPKPYSWSPTFAHADEQPFGCALFDSLLSASVPSGYRLSQKTLYQLSVEDTLPPRGILVVGDRLSFSDLDVAALLRLAERGNKILLAAHDFSWELEDTLDFSCNSFSFPGSSFKRYVSSGGEKDTIRWVGDSARYAPRSFCAYPHFCNIYFELSDSLSCDTLAEDVCVYADADTLETLADTVAAADDCRLVFAWKCHRGRGEVILASTPLAFTNYGVLDDDLSPYVFRLLSQLSPLPVVRLESSASRAAPFQGSPLRYILSNKALRWALYLAVAGILLFMLFTAKRKQRAIPVVREPENKSLEFVKLIGTLYYQRGDHADLVRKKFVCLCDVLRRKCQVDIESGGNDEAAFERIAQKTGLDVEAVSKRIRGIRNTLGHGKGALSPEQMKTLIDQMDEIIKHT